MIKRLLMTTILTTLLFSTSAASAIETSVQLRKTVILNADGSLTALVTYTCPSNAAYWNASLTVNVQQSKAGATTFGTGFANGRYSSTSGTSGTLRCTGSPETDAINVKEYNGPGFGTGKAFVDVLFGVCDPATCTSSLAEDFVRITK